MHNLNVTPKKNCCLRKTQTNLGNRRGDLDSGLNSLWLKEEGWRDNCEIFHLLVEPDPVDSARIIIVFCKNLCGHPVNAPPALLQPPPCLQLPFLLQQASPWRSPGCLFSFTSTTCSASWDRAEVDSCPSTKTFSSPWWLLIVPSPHWAACQQRWRRWSSLPPPYGWTRQASTLSIWFAFKLGLCLVLV